MVRLLRVALQEYRRNVFKRSFIFAVLSVPLMVGGIVALVFIMENFFDSAAPVGYVDRSGLFEDPVSVPPERYRRPVEIIPFDTEEAARAALEADDIQAYYIIEADYASTGRVTLVYNKQPGDVAMRQFTDFLQANLLAGQPAEVVNRAVEGTSVTIRAADGSREYPGSAPSLGSVVAAAVSVMFLLLVIMSSGWMLNAVVDEKDNRTMEVLVTSVSTGQLIAGKVLGIVGISLTQFAVWVLCAAIAVFVCGNVLDIAWFQQLHVDWRAVLSVVIIAIPSYVLAAALMTAVGATVGEAREGQQIMGLLVQPYLIPTYTSFVLIEYPSSVLSTALGLLPFTSLMATGLQTVIMVIPWWRVAVSAAIQTLCAVGAIWLAGRALRLGMLRYGQRLRLRELFSRQGTIHAPEGAS